MDLLAWWNLIFLLPAAAALFYLLLIATGTVDAGEGGEADVDGDVDLDVDADAESSPSVDTLGFLGFGRVPLSIVLMTLCFLWGFVGWATNTLLDGVSVSPARFVWVSILVAGVLSIGGTGFLAKGLARFLPTTESYGSSQRDLIGRLGKVRDTVTERGGRVQVVDVHGTLHEVPSRVKLGQAAIPPRTEVVLVRFDEARGVYEVLADPLGET